MENSSYQIISFLSNESGTEKTSFIYDTFNRRIIEKWKCYRLLSDDSKYIITDRFIYAYNRYGNINKILEIEKGPDERMFKYLNDDNEYCHSINRAILYDGLNYQNNNTKTEIIYTRNNHLGSKKKKHFLRSLVLERDNSQYREAINIRLKYLLMRNGKQYTYEYCKYNFNELLNIVEYKILVDLRIINRIFNFIGIPLLMSIPDLFVKRRIKKQPVKSIYKIQRVKIFKQDYYSSFSNDEVFINDIIFIEDIFIKEQNNLINEYESAFSRHQ